MSWYVTTPSAYRSALAPASSPRACSGARSAAVPSTDPTCVMLHSSAALAIPKSPSLTCPSLARQSHVEGQVDGRHAAEPEPAFQAVAPSDLRLAHLPPSFAPGDSPPSASPPAGGWDSSLGPSVPPPGPGVSWVLVVPVCVGA